jgi:tetratricopeptide (TPR) repeat protein
MGSERSNTGNQHLPQTNQSAHLTHELSEALCVCDIQKVDRYINSPAFKAISRSDQTFYLGCYHWECGNNKEAERYLQECLQVVPEHIGAAKCLASIYDNRMDYEKARSIWQGLITRQPSDFRSQVRLLLDNLITGIFSSDIEQILALVEVLNKSIERDSELVLIVGRILLRKALHSITEQSYHLFPGAKTQHRPNTTVLWEERKTHLSLIKAAARLFDEHGSPVAKQYRWLCEVVAFEPRQWSRMAVDWLANQPEITNESVPLEVRWIAGLIKGMVPDFSIALHGAADLVEIAISTSNVEVWKEVMGFLWRIVPLAREPKDFVELIKCIREFNRIDPRVEKSMTPLMRKLAMRGLCREYEETIANSLHELVSLSDRDELLIHGIRNVCAGNRESVTRIDTKLSYSADQDIEYRLQALAEFCGNFAPDGNSPSPSLETGQLPLGLEFLSVVRQIQQQDHTAPRALCDWLLRPGSLQVLKDVDIPVSGILAYLGTEGIRQTKDYICNILRTIDLEYLNHMQDGIEAYLRSCVAAGIGEEAIRNLTNLKDELGSIKEDVLRFECYIAAQALEQRNYSEARYWLTHVVAKVG